MVLIEEKGIMSHMTPVLYKITRATKKGFNSRCLPAVYSIFTEFYDRSKMQEENYAGKENYSKQISYLQDINQYPDKVAFIKEAKGDTSGMV